MVAAKSKEVEKGEITVLIYPHPGAVRAIRPIPPSVLCGDGSAGHLHHHHHYGFPNQMAIVVYPENGRLPKKGHDDHLWIFLNSSARHNPSGFRFLMYWPCQTQCEGRSSRCTMSIIYEEHRP
jgi:hypothetical protein